MRDYKKFFTPDDVADFMVSKLKISHEDIILEPSAGDGAIVRAIVRANDECEIVAIEKDKKWVDDLWKSNAANVRTGDFLSYNTLRTQFTKCIANPPFGNETDIYSHYHKIRDCVMYGGEIIMIVPKDFDPRIQHNEYPLENWSTNSDGTKTEIKIIHFLNQ